MKNADFYYMVQNPLEANALFIMCIDSFKIGRLRLNFGNFVEKKDFYKINEQEYNKMHTRIFNRWKKTLIERTRAEWMQLINKGYVETDVFELIEYLKIIPDAKTNEEILNYMGCINEKGMSNLLQKYGDGIHVSTLFNTGTYVTNDYIKISKEMKVEHRLYFNVPRNYRHHFINVLIDECEAHDLPYNIKIFEDEDRPDNVILYCDTATLLEYYKILIQMEYKYPKLLGMLLPPSILTGKVTNWMGYGAEPKSGLSYNSEREFALGWSTIDLYKEWLKENSEKVFIYEGRIISFGEYLAREIGLILNTEYGETKANLGEIIKPHSHELESFDFITAEMIIESCNKWIQNSINNKFGADAFVLEALQLSDYDRDRLSDIIINLIDNYFIEIAKNSPVSKEKFLKILKKRCEKSKIDQDKFCFNDDSLELLIAEDKRRTQESLTPQIPPHIIYQNSQKSVFNPKERYQRHIAFKVQREQRRTEATERIMRDREQRHEEAKLRYSYRGGNGPINPQQDDRRRGRN